MNAKRMLAVLSIFAFLLVSIQVAAQDVRTGYTRKKIRILSPQKTQLTKKPLPMIGAVRTAYIWPGFDCVIRDLPYYAPTENNALIGALQFGRNLGVTGSDSSINSSMGSDLVIQCPIRIPKDSTLTGVTVSGKMRGGNPATEMEEESHLQISLMREAEVWGFAPPVGNFKSVTVRQSEIGADESFSAELSGSYKVESLAYPLYVNIAVSEPNAGKDFPRGWSFWLRQIQIDYFK